MHTVVRIKQSFFEQLCKFLCLHKAMNFSIFLKTDFYDKNNEILVHSSKFLLSIHYLKHL